MSPTVSLVASTPGLFKADDPEFVTVSDGTRVMLLPLAVFQSFDTDGLKTLFDSLTTTSDPRRTPVRWRVGNKNARNVYMDTKAGEFHVGVMFTEPLGRYVVEHLNRCGATTPPVEGIGEPVPSKEVPTS